MPSESGVYLMKKKDKILYVGKAKSLKTRVKSYFKTKNLSVKNQFLVSQVEDVDYMVTNNEVEAFLLEASLIKKHKPRYNIRLKDDKAYPYIRFSKKDDFPRFYFERKVKDEDSLYFGPYTPAYLVTHLLDFLNQQFLLRDCSDSDFKTRKKPCLSYDMGICKAPCVSKVSKKEYQKQGLKALDFLKGHVQDVITKMEEEMKTLL